MTMTDPTTTGEGRTLNLPALSVPAGHDERVDEAQALITTLKPQVEHLGNLMRQIREVNDDCLRALGAAGIPIDAEDVNEMVGAFTQWYPIWNHSARLTDHIASDPMDISVIRNSETARGGEPDFPIGTRAMVPLPDDSDTVVVKVAFLPVNTKDDGWLYTVDTVADGTRFMCSHEEIKAGLAPEHA